MRGNLTCEMTCSCPNLAYAMSVISRFVTNPKNPHREAVKLVRRYVKGTANSGLIYTENESEMPYLEEGFVGADFASDLDKRRSTAGCV